MGGLNAVGEALDRLIYGGEESVTLIGEVEQCYLCEGEGRILGSKHGYRPGIRHCPNCKGSGKVVRNLRISEADNG